MPFLHTEEYRQIVTFNLCVTQKCTGKSIMRSPSMLVGKLSQTQMNFKILHVGDKIYTQV